MAHALEIDVAAETERIAKFISRFVEERGDSGAVLGLSGGLDSSVAAALCARALSADRVTVLLLPERDSSKESVDDARKHAELLGVRYRKHDLTPALRELGCYEGGGSDVVRFKGGARKAVQLFPGLARKGYLNSLRGKGGKQFQEFTAFFRIKHRLRMVSVYREAERANLVAVSCANRTEFETGFFVRYGDDAGDIAPIKHLYKTQVFRLGQHLGVPRKILDKQPSPDLFAGLKDEEIMGISYEELDGILIRLSQGFPPDVIGRELHTDEKKVRFVMEMKSVSQRLRDEPASLLGA